MTSDITQNPWYQHYYNIYNDYYSQRRQQEQQAMEEARRQQEQAQRDGVVNQLAGTAGQLGGLYVGSQAVSALSGGGAAAGGGAAIGSGAAGGASIGGAGVASQGVTGTAGALSGAGGATGGALSGAGSAGIGGASGAGIGGASAPTSLGVGTQASNALAGAPLNAVGTTTTATGAPAWQMADGSVVSQSSSTLGSTIGTAAAVAGLAAGAYGLYENWGRGGADGRRNSAISGAAAGYGAGALAASYGAAGSAAGPWGAVIGAVIGLAIGSVKKGKHKDQMKRDAYRGLLEKVGIAEKVDGSHNVTLFDGTKYDIGVDGRNLLDKSFANPDMLLNREAVNDEGKVRPYEVDYTNDLDFMTSLGANALMAMTAGDNEDGAMQMGGYLTNAATSQTGREFNAETWAKSRENMRGFYAQAGITNEDEANQLIQKMVEEGRIDDATADVYRQGTRLVFRDDSFDFANELNATRWETVGNLPPSSAVDSNADGKPQDGSKPDFTGITGVDTQNQGKKIVGWTKTQPPQPIYEDGTIGQMGSGGPLQGSDFQRPIPIPQQQQQQQPQRGLLGLGSR